jgi:hypothetical protein
MAAARQDDSEDPAMDPADDPDLLIEGEGEPQDEGQNDELIADEWEHEEAQYQFDDEEDAAASHIEPARSESRRTTSPSLS